jgi:DNA-binding NtrC family response regulator
MNAEKGRAVTGFEQKALDRLLGHDWPGNVRELENLIERMVVMRGEGVLDVTDLPGPFRRGDAPPEPVVPSIGAGGIEFNTVIDHIETRLILEALEKTGGNKNQAARLLGLNRTTLIEKIKKKGLESRAAARDGSGTVLRGVQ